MMNLSEDHLKKLIERVPAKINFAGLSGTTADMVRNGWELNVMKHDESYRGCVEIRIGGRHKAMNLHFMSGSFTLDYEFFHSRQVQADPRMIFSRIPWEIKMGYVAQNLIVSMDGEARSSVISRDWSGYMDIFKPMSSTPFEKLFEFPEASSQIYIPENKIWTVQEHLEAIRSAQQPLQDEILKDSMNQPAADHKQLLKLVAI